MLWTYKNSHPLNVHRFKNISSCKDDFSILPPPRLDVKCITSPSAVRERPSLLCQEGSARASAHLQQHFRWPFLHVEEVPIQMTPQFPRQQQQLPSVHTLQYALSLDQRSKVNFLRNSALSLPRLFLSPPQSQLCLYFFLRPPNLPKGWELCTMETLFILSVELGRATPLWS